MIKTCLYTIAFTLLAAVSFGQKQESQNTDNSAYNGTFARMHYWNYTLSSAKDTSVIKDILRRELNLTANTDLVVTHMASSLTATHITFKQRFKGADVFGGEAKVAVSANNILFRCIETFFSTDGNLAALPNDFAVQLNLPEFNQIEIIESKAVYLWDGERLLPGWYAQFTHGQNGFHDAAWWANGSRYFLRDRLLYAKDSAVTLKVFSPDPITPINKVYGGMYVDNNDANESVLNPLQQTVQAIATFNSDTFYLRSNFVKIVEAENPVNPIVKSTTPNFNFSRSGYEFEQVNAFYHISAYQNYLQSLGYSLVQYQIRVDANGWNGDDQSSFNSGANPLLSFGEGGVDDAEDADVIVHEYGHAISHSATPNTVSGNERRCLDEAFGDYVAVSYKRNVYSFGSNFVFNWDGHNTFWSGRTVNNPNNYNYKNIQSFNNIYTYTTLWNDAMFDIWDQLGKTYTDKLQLEALYGYAKNMSFKQAANLVLDADTALSNGANTTVITQAFVARGILDWISVAEFAKNKTPYLIKNTLCNAANPVLIFVEGDGFSVALQDVNGRQILTQNLAVGENEIFVGSLPNGMYILLIRQDGKAYAEKIIVTK